MDIITLEKANHMFWLGRYTERVFQTIFIYMKLYDVMIDIDPNAYIEFCKNLEIDNIYKDSDDFNEKYVYSSDNFDSIISSLKRAYDNAVVLREEITGDTIAYIELSLNILKHRDTKSTVLELQRVVDYLYAFWGSIDDTTSQSCRNIIKCGKYAERVDLFYRFDIDDDKLERQMEKLKSRIDKLNSAYNIDGLSSLKINDKEDYLSEVTKLSNFFEEE